METNAGDDDGEATAVDMMDIQMFKTIMGALWFTHWFMIRWNFQQEVRSLRLLERMRIDGSKD